MRLASTVFCQLRSVRAMVELVKAQADAISNHSRTGQRVPMGTIKLSKLKACVNRLEIPIFIAMRDV